MAFLRQTREALLLCHAIKVIDEEELLLLFDVNKSKNPGYPYWNHNAFDLDLMTDDVPDAIKYYNGVVVDGVEALCIMSKRFSYPCQYVDMMPTFG